MANGPSSLHSPVFSSSALDVEEAVGEAEEVEVWTADTATVAILKMKEVVVIAMFEGVDENRVVVWKAETISSTEDDKGGSSGGCMCGLGGQQPVVTVP